jgi:hypothetical protein
MSAKLLDPRDVAAFLLYRADRYGISSPSWTALGAAAAAVLTEEVQAAKDNGDLDADLYARVDTITRAERAERVEGVRKPTHRCKVCGALWIKNPPNKAQPEGSWSLAPVSSQVAGPCCDNALMSDQIEELP